MAEKVVIDVTDAEISNVATIDRRHSSRRAEDDAPGRWNTRERDSFRDDLTSTITGQLREETISVVKQLREEIAERDLADRERRIREEAEREAKLALAKEAADKKKKDSEAWEQRVKEADEERKTAEERRKDRWQKAWMGLIGAFTAAVTGFGTYFGTRPPPPPVEEAEKVKEEAQAAKDMAVEAAFTASKTDVEQDQKLRQLGLQSVDQVVLEVDTTEYQADMMKAMSRAARDVPEPESLKTARKKAKTIKEHQSDARKRGELYDPFTDLPDPDSNPEIQR